MINNNLGIDMELVYVADTVIATVERVVDELERSTDGVIIPYPGCDLVVELQQGAGANELLSLVSIGWRGDSPLYGSLQCRSISGILA